LLKRRRKLGGLVYSAPARALLTVALALLCGAFVSRT
jgi:hypothetical protein